MSVSSERLGGSDGNEMLTAAVAVVLTLLLAAEGITILDVRGLLTPHMFIGLLLIPPVLVKLGSTGYRFARYYIGTGPYREKGPPMLLLRLFAPLLVAATIAVFATGVGLLIAGHRSGLLFDVHKASFFVWAGVFAVHFLAHLPAMARSLSREFTRARPREVAGTRLRLALVLTAVTGGVVLALALLGPITGWHGGD